MKKSERSWMSFNYKLEEYKNWLEENIILSDPFSSQALRKLTYHLLMGKNYRLLTESNTKGQLFATFLWLYEIRNEAQNLYGNEWIKHLFKNIYTEKSKPKELKNLLLWIMGITQKTAINLGLKQQDFSDFIHKTIEYFNELFEKIGKEEFRDDAWLLLMAGSATLNIRGSQKSKIGKHFEKVFIRSLLNLLGFKEDENFWMNVERDLEVEREADAEVESKRGRIRIEMDLLHQGIKRLLKIK
jgi:hypothetical protein